MRRQLRICAVAGLLFAMLTPAAFAHTTIRQTVPPSGAVLSESPAFIEITFEHMAQLTSVVVAVPGHRERKLGFQPIGLSLDFRLPEPALVPGRNEVHWKGLSDDGHVIEGTLVFVIEPAATK